MILKDLHISELGCVSWRGGLAGLFFMVAVLPMVVWGRPVWIADPKNDDSIYVYSVGSAQGLASAEAAERAAYRDALLRILRTHRSDITDPERWPMQHVEIVPGCIYREESAGGHSCWVQIMWPQRERANLVEQLTEAGKQEDQLQQARAMVAEGRASDSRALLMTLFKQQVEKPSPVLSPVELQLQIARSWQIENRPIEARQWLDRVIELAPADDPLVAEARQLLDTLPSPGPLWPLHARFAGGPVGLVMVSRRGGDWQNYRDLRRAFAQAFRAIGVETHDWGRKLDDDDLQDLVEDSFEGVTLDGVESAPIGLLVAVEVDPAKIGATKMVFGTAMPVMDTRVRVVAYDVAAGVRLYEESFAAMLGTRTEANFAEYVLGIVTEDYLMPHCPGVKRTLEEQM